MIVFSIQFRFLERNDLSNIIGLVYGKSSEPSPDIAEKPETFPEKSKTFPEKPEKIPKKTKKIPKNWKNANNFFAHIFTAMPSIRPCGATHDSRLPVGRMT